ncbi:putative integrase [Drosophila-associated adintovirus 3]|uniref:Integrase n=1 Tax=Drosophila-associated adintovirus 3 TaxID=2744818 RepID=A0A7D4VFB6_9VIRU|nr:putative integrase [Drosophila-associated adintovirus 3]
MSRVKKIKELYADPRYGLVNLKEFSKRVWEQLKYMVTPKELEEILKDQLVYNLNKRVTKPKEFRKYTPMHPMEYLQMDLMEVPKDEVEANDGYKFILTCIDSFSKFAFAIPLRNKTAENTLYGVRKIMKKAREFNKDVIHLQTDKGKEFYNSTMSEYFKENNIEHYSTESIHKAAIVERFHGTLRRIIVKYQTASGDLNYMHELSSLISNYNNKVHSTIKVTPEEALRDPKPVKEIFQNMIQPATEKTLKVGTKVRIQERVNPLVKQGKFIKVSDNQGWSKTMFKIEEVDDSRKPVLYKLQGQGRKFYRSELLRV